MDLKVRLWIYEGTKEYQTKMNYFRNGKFYPYKDSLGKLTIGCGHLVLKSENFSDGITEKKRINCYHEISRMLFWRYSHWD
jgi:GH24 family phage-related lysozyme (muramidase)